MESSLHKIQSNLDSILCWLLLCLPVSLAIYFGFHSPQGSGHPTDYAIYCTAAEIVRLGHGTQLYDLQVQKDIFYQVTKNKYPIFLVWNHHPVEALLYLPTTLLSYETGLYFMRLFSASILSILVVWVAMKIGLDAGRLFLLWLILMLGIRSFIFAIQAGQDSIWILSLIVLGLTAAAHNKPTYSGVFLGVASVKFTIVLPLLMILLLCRFHKVVAISFAVALSLILLPCIFFGPRVLQSYLVLCISLISMNGQFGMYPALLRSFRGILYKWAPSLFPHSIALSALLGGLYAIACRKFPNHLVLPLALFGAAFFSPHVFAHDTVMYVGSAMVYLATTQLPRNVSPHVAT